MDGTLKGDPLKAAVKKLVDLNAKYLTPGSSAAAACPAGGSGGGASSSSASAAAAAAAAAPSPPRRASPSSGSSRPGDLTPMKPEAPREFREDRSVRKIVESAVAEHPGDFVIDKEFVEFFVGEGVWARRRREGLALAVKAVVTKRIFRYDQYLGLAADRPSMESEGQVIYVLERHTWTQFLAVMAPLTTRVVRQVVGRARELCDEIDLHLRSNTDFRGRSLWPFFHHVERQMCLSDDMA